MWVHPGTKSIDTATVLCVPNNEGSVLISCTTGLVLGLIKPHTSLDHLPPGSNIISSSADQPGNNKSQLNVHMLMESYPSSPQVQRRFLLCVQIKNNVIQC